MDPDNPTHKSHSRWLVAGAVITAGMTVALALWPKGDVRLAALSDISSLALSVAIFAMLVRCAYATQRRVRVFWILMAAGIALRTFNIGLWVFYEVVLGRPTPQIFWASTMGFLQVLPALVATALMPHRREKRKTRRMAAIDTFIVAMWWTFIYLYSVIPWQFIQLDLQRYSANFNMLYLVEQLTLLSILLFFWMQSQEPWSRVYKFIFYGQSLYSIASFTISLATDLPKNSSFSYYSGSWYDIPYNLSLLYWLWVAVQVPGWLKSLPEEVPKPMISPFRWSTVVAALVVLSVPGMALLALASPLLPEPIRQYRLLLSAVIEIFLIIALVLKLTLLNRDLFRLFRRTEDTLENLRQVQGQLLHAEKLAAVSRLVAGTIHEINNPLTAIHGYSELITADPLISDETRSYVEKIRKSSRRVKLIVQDLATFGRPTNVGKELLDVGQLLERAITHRSPMLKNGTMRTNLNLSPELPSIAGDEAHLLQVFLHIIDNAIFVMKNQTKQKELNISTTTNEQQVVIRFSDTGPGVSQPDHVFDPFYTTKDPGEGTGLGLSVAYGVIREHGGRIRCFNRPEGGATFEITLPASSSR